MRWLILLALPVLLSPLSSPQTLVCDQSLSPPLVFAHYMLITRPPEDDYSQDIVGAVGASNDAIALNYSGYNANWSDREGYLADFYSAVQAYNSATQGKKIHVFISFDTTSPPNALTAQMCINLTNRYANHPAQLHVNGTMMLSSFQTTDPWEWKANFPTSTVRDSSKPQAFSSKHKRQR